MDSFFAMVLTGFISGVVAGILGFKLYKHWQYYLLFIAFVIVFLLGYYSR
jgi:hypothetical protein